MPKRVYGKPGASARRRHDSQPARWVVPVVAAAVALVVAGVAVRAFGQPGWIGLLAAAAAVALVPLAMRRFRRADRDLSWAKGATSEREVGRILDELGDDYHVLHDVDTGRGTVDYVVVGPTGVFVIETKGHRGRASAHDGGLYVNGHEKNWMLQQTYAEAMAVKHWLDGADGGRRHWVTPLLVFTHATVRSRGKAWNVYVLEARRLRTLIENYGTQRLDADRRSAIVHALEHFRQNRAA